MHEYNTLYPWRPGDGFPTEGILMLRHGPRGGGDLPSMDEPLTDDGIEATKCVGRRWVIGWNRLLFQVRDRCLCSQLWLKQWMGY